MNTLPWLGNPIRCGFLGLLGAWCAVPIIAAAPAHAGTRQVGSERQIDSNQLRITTVAMSDSDDLEICVELDHLDSERPHDRITVETVLNGRGIGPNQNHPGECIWSSPSASERPHVFTIHLPDYGIPRFQQNEKFVVSAKVGDFQEAQCTASILLPVIYIPGIDAGSFGPLGGQILDNDKGMAPNFRTESWKIVRNTSDTNATTSRVGRGYETDLLASNASASPSTFTTPSASPSPNPAPPPSPDDAPLPDASPAPDDAPLPGPDDAPVLDVPSTSPSNSLISPATAHSGYPTLYVLSYFRNADTLLAAATKLKQFIDEVRQRTYADKINLIGHSRGGLVERYYVEHFPEASSKVNVMVMAEVPNLGSVYAVPGRNFGRLLSLFYHPVDDNVAGADGIYNYKDLYPLWPWSRWTGFNRYIIPKSLDYNQELLDLNGMLSPAGVQSHLKLPQGIKYILLYGDVFDSKSDPSKYGFREPTYCSFTYSTIGLALVALGTKLYLSRGKYEGFTSIWKGFARADPDLSPLKEIADEEKADPEAFHGDLIVPVFSQRGQMGYDPNLPSPHGPRTPIPAFQDALMHQNLVEMPINHMHLGYLDQEDVDAYIVQRFLDDIK